MSQQYPQQPYYQQGYQTAAYQPAQQVDSADSVGSWVLTIFLMGIPLVGLIYMIVLAAGDGRSLAKRNFARAYLIWIGIGIALAIILGIIAAVTGGLFFTAFFSELSHSSSYSSHSY